MSGRYVTLVGTHPDSDVYDLDGTDLATEFWCANESHRSVDVPSRIFQVHPRDWRERERRFLYKNDLPEGVDPDCFGRNTEHVEYLRTCGVPVICQQRWDDIPTSEVYPFAAVRGAVGIPLPPNGLKRLWATSTFGYMAALALTEHLNGDRIAKLGLAGIELPKGTDRERKWEWPNLAYYLGLAVGCGIEIVLPRCGTTLLSAPLYAIDNHPQPGDMDHWWGPGEIVVTKEDDVWGLHGSPLPEPESVAV